MEKIKCFEAHTDYIRSIYVHPTQPLIISSSDDSTIRIFNWEENFNCTKSFFDHQHYVMQITLNPRDHNMLASGSLDKSIKVILFYIDFIKNKCFCI